MLGVQVQANFTTVGNYPLGAATSLLMLAAFVALYFAMRAGAAAAHGSTGCASRDACARARSLAITVAALLFLYVPLAVVVLFSFHETGSLSLPFTGFSLRWYRLRALGSGLQLRALEQPLRRCLDVARSRCCSGRSPPSGSRARARGCAGRSRCSSSCRSRSRASSSGSRCSSSSCASDLKLSLTTVVIAHCVYVFPYFLLIATAALDRLDPALEEAAADLGANGWTALLARDDAADLAAARGRDLPRLRALVRRVHHHVLRDRLRRHAAALHLVAAAPHRRSVDQRRLDAADGGHARCSGCVAFVFALRGARRRSARGDDSRRRSCRCERAGRRRHGRPRHPPLRPGGRARRRQPRDPPRASS